MIILGSSGDLIYVVKDKDEANKVYRQDKTKLPFIYLEEEYRATVPLDTADVEKIEAKKKSQPGYIYKKGDILD